MKAKDIDVSHWTDPEVQWQTIYIDRAQRDGIEELMRFAKSSAQELVEKLVPKINAAVIRSRS